MKILLIGTGAREHALAWKLAKSPLLTELFLWPGNAGSRRLGTTLDLDPSADFASVATVAKELGIKAVICGPEQPLEAGLADFFWAQGLPVFGPKKAAAMLESSKQFAKMTMAKAGIRTASYALAYSEAECLELAMGKLKEAGGVVLKASGLASGKGVCVCTSEEEVKSGIQLLYGQSMRHASETVVLETVLKGRECSYFTFVGQGKSTPLGFAVDFKRLRAGDLGPNTGGMGSYSPVPWLPKDAGPRVEAEVVQPLLKTLQAEGIDYCGWLYVGLMWNDLGPQVIEFNVRLGDPEAQVLAVADERDWLALILEKIGVQELPAAFPLWEPDKCAVAVVMASSGYPFGGQIENPSTLPGTFFINSSAPCLFAGAVQASPTSDSVVVGSGRVVTVVADGRSFAEAKERVMRRVYEIAEIWPGCQWREDIANNVIEGA